MFEAIIEAVDTEATTSSSIEPLADVDAPAELDDDIIEAFEIEIEQVNSDVGPANLDDSVRMYLREIGQVKLLDAARRSSWPRRWNAGVPGAAPGAAYQRLWGTSCRRCAWASALPFVRARVAAHRRALCPCL
ncbi:MAG: sigma-70 factor domain-containing protein [Thermomicrobiales bacterium]